MTDENHLEATQKFEPESDGSFDQVATPAADYSAPALPQTVGRYRIARLLGKGGFGLVYLAHDDQLQRLVAIKVPHPELVAKATDADAYLAEARTVANLDHPNIVPVHDVGSTVELPCFVVSKYIDGTDLAKRLKRSRLSVQEVVELTATVAEALHYAHKRGLVHRDIKPGNILLDRNGEPFVADFGLALREQDLGKGPRYAGTPAYMSPEQARGEGHRVDGRSDIFSLGIVVYELLAGRRPFKAESQRELLEQITSFEARPLRQINDDIPKELERICFKALSKRASERYMTAKDFAEDLRHFLAESLSGGKFGLMGEEPVQAAVDTAIPTPTTDPVSDTQTIKVIPKGLRSFDNHDADFFLEMLPGPRDRNGLPDSIRFWKTRIEAVDADNTFSVGLIYGPSGSGKSSLVKAGLLPNLSNAVLAVYVEATANETEKRLLHGIRKRCYDLPADLGLKETLTVLRRGQGISVGEKLLIVLDQFEQWLHGNREKGNNELVQALRHCDGGRVQCILMIRDDFWLAVSRFMKVLEVEILEGRNSALVDLFDQLHARKVLKGFGRALGRLPGNLGQCSKEQHAFIDQAVAGLSQEGKVISIRLALFAEMMKGKVWTPATLKAVGGMDGIGFTFLEETFSASTAPPQHRLHQKAAQAVLKALLPEAGIDIKGHMRSQNELLEASGYASRQQDFDDLVKILDGEIRLITPTDPEGKDGADESATRTGVRYYQLTHDYLVPSLRDWLNRKQKETRQGRAELRLIERAALWNEKRENRHLPSWWEYLTVVTLVPVKGRTSAQQKMLAKAGRVHVARWACSLALTVILGFMVTWLVFRERLEKLRGQTVTAVNAVRNNRGSAVAFTIRDLEKLPREMVLNELKHRYLREEEDHKLGLAYALAEYGEVDTAFLCSEIKRSAPEEADNIVVALGRDVDGTLKALIAMADSCHSEQDWRRKARFAIVALHLGYDEIAAEMCQIDDRPDPVQRTIFMDEFPVWHGDLSRLATLYGTATDSALRSALCIAVGSIPKDHSILVENTNWKTVIGKWHAAALDNVTHSASGWALRRWKSDLPTLDASSQPVDRQDWFLNLLGMTMLKIRPGDFVRRTDVVARETKQSSTHLVKLTKSFYLCDREVSIDQFRVFIDDPQCPAEEKPANWPEDEDRNEIRPYPQGGVNWHDAVMFCNWLSRKEGLAACYERVGKREEVRGSNNQVADDIRWKLAADRTGYRLPTEAEWEYACRAGTTTDFSSGSDVDLLRKYAVFTTGNTRQSAPCGSKLPNGWGLFDMHGNIWEWCYDWHSAYIYGDTGDTSDPIGPSEMPSGGAPPRVGRGGAWLLDASVCRSPYRSRNSPVSRINYLGFRIARNAFDFTQ